MRTVGSADQTAIFRELTRILNEEGVPAALAHGATQAPGILAGVQAGCVGERRVLQPLLTVANLLTNNRRLADA